MNNPSPLVPLGSFQEQKNKGRARVKIAVFFVLAVHGVGLLALLMQGCNKPEQSAPPVATTEPTNTPAPPTFVEVTNAPAPLPVPATTAPPASNPPVAQTPLPTPVPETATPPALTPAAGSTEYKVAKGDSFSSIAKKNHVSLKALMEANPGVEPTKLKIGQTLHIPAAGTSGTATGGGLSEPATSGGGQAAGGEQMYTVKSGDTLSKIASHAGVSVKALRAANNLKTDRITVGQKLKLPTKPSGAPVPGASSGATETAPTPPPGGVGTPPGQ